MQILASGDETAKILIVIIGVLVFAAALGWKVYAVVKAAKTKGSAEDKQKAVGGALFGGLLGDGGAYGKGYDVGKKAGEKLASLFKSKDK